MPSDAVDRLYASIRAIPDFPEKGVLFRDITPLLLNPDLLSAAVDELAEPLHDLQLDRILAIESRGFIFGSPLAMKLGVGMALARKPGKLPAECRRIEYSLEYGKDAIEMHTDAVSPGQRVLVVDDLLATGGTAKAAAELLTDAGAVLAGYSFLIELAFLNGRDKLPDAPVFSILNYT